PTMTAGMYYQDFEIGAVYRTAGKTMTETDLVNFIGVSGIFEELYGNVDYAMNQSVFRGRVVPGLCTVSIAEGLIVQSGIFHHTGMALLGIDQLRFVAPVFVNDTITVESSCVDMRW